MFERLSPLLVKPVRLLGGSDIAAWVDEANDLLDVLEAELLEHT
eukprot:CAMPEP_0173440682 /NCGR_PEP_ID=MMETSP1357-20121228/23403_1 /TAXON_ID=77926 /ORGANISM="Hemiselmis rufescens, Strain PCC563" /LENGTH=43 /DNA_ID= /DNA_START= /DNA_END= /DNA_ORIENTATION=